jgi:hypothetical protein
MRHLNLISILIIFALLGLNKVSISQTCATCPGNNVTGVSVHQHLGQGDTVSGDYSFAAAKILLRKMLTMLMSIGSFSKAQGLSNNNWKPSIQWGLLICIRKQFNF